MIVFMTVNIIISAMALARYSDRQTGKEAANSIDYFLDDHFPDKRMEWIYPNAIVKDNSAVQTVMFQTPDSLKKSTFQWRLSCLSAIDPGRHCHVLFIHFPASAHQSV